MKDIGLLLLLVGLGLTMIIGHGYPKLMNIINGNMEFADPIGIGQAPTLILAALAEVVFPILIIIGYKTRLATVPTALTMAVAFFIFHANDPFGGSKELALVFLIGFVSIGLIGPGKHSIDRS